MEEKIMKKNGFSLIELMMTVAIVGVLSSIAIPTYKNYSIKSHRVEGKSLIMEIMQRQEKYYTENNTYTTNLTLLGYSSSTVISEQGYYSLTAAAAADGIINNVILTAQPIGSQASDSECGSFIMNSNGQKTTSTSSTTCWNK